MVRGMFKSRTLRRVKVKTPGNRVVTHFKPRKPKKLTCRMCKSELKGTINVRPSQISKFGKSERMPSRAYPDLCSKCSRTMIVKKAISSELNS